MPVRGWDSKPLEDAMRTRVQLTSYLGGKYQKGMGANFEVLGIDAVSVREALAEIGEIARRRAAIEPGSKPSRGGWRVRIQISNKDGEGAYRHQDGSEGGSLDVSVPGMRAADAAPLVDHRLAVRFGVRRGDPAALLRAWEAFAGKSGGAEGEAIVRPDLVGVVYSRRLHLGMFAVVEGKGLRVSSLWGCEVEAVGAARRIGARVVDAEGYMIPCLPMAAEKLGA
jgi:hypothetical protein